MPKTIDIAGRSVGEYRPTFVIAEIGVNHDGSVARALELVQLAKEAGADAVKLQVFQAATLMHSSSQFAEYQQQTVNDADPATMLRRYELSDVEIRQVVSAIRDSGMVPIATPFSPSDVRVLAELKLPAVKIASPDLVNWPLLSAVVKLNVPIILSTGAATMNEVVQTCEWMREWKAKFALLHCISNYPTGEADANLRWIREIATKAKVPVGYSDHTSEISSGAFAVAFGASIVEKHLTYDCNASGPDHAASADGNQFAEYVRMIRLAEKLRGTAGKRVLDVEQDVRRVSRQSLVATRTIAAGEKLGEGDVTVQRPGTGISAADLKMAVGRITSREIARGTLLQWDMLGDAV